jgi:hypothetical protein
MVERGASIGMKTLGPILCTVYYVLISFNAFIYLEHLLPLSYNNLSIFYTVIFFCMGLWILFCVVYCHFKAMWSHPGFVSNYYVSQ